MGIGLTKAYCKRYSTQYFIDPNKSLPYRIAGGRIEAIPGKMSKYFKTMIQYAYANGLTINMFYNDYYEEAVLTIKAESGVITLFPFNPQNWQASNLFVIAPTDVTSVSTGAHCSVSYNSGTGIVTYTPAANYVGTDTATFTFTPPGGSPITLNNCLQWTAGSGNVNPFNFIALTGVGLSTVQTSNSILVSGNDYPVAISITGSTGLGYSINGGAFTSSAGTVNNGDTVQVRVTASGSTNTSTSCTLTIDSQSSTFNVTTRLAGNFTVGAQYGMSVVSVQNGSATGVPGAFNPCNLSPGQTLSAAYTTLSASGTVSVALTGTPAIPGHVRLFLSVNGVEQSHTPVSGGGSFSLNTGTGGTNPDLILIGLETF